MGKLLLTLDTLVPDRDYIEIKDGEITHKIEMRADDELSLMDRGYIARTAKLFDPRFILEPSEEAKREMKGFFDNVLRIILVSPDPDVVAKLSETKKTQILFAFSQAVAQRGGRAPTEEAGSQLTGAESSPDSAGSMAAN